MPFLTASLSSAPGLCLLVLTVVASATEAQTPQPAAKPPASQSQTAPATPTLYTAAKLVIVDVVVTDRNHHPVHNLKAQDFSVAESGQPQTVNHFEEHTGLTASEAAKAPVMPPMPPGIFTNYVPTPTNSAVNILLLDALNTPLKDQQYVRQQLLDYLKHAHPGANTAIFGLSTHLVMLQGFTSNVETLKSIVTKANGGASVLLDDAVGGAGMPDTASDMNDASGGLMPADVVASMQTFMDITTSFQLTLRAKYTLDAMNVLARYLSAIPGRKNLIWFSGSFPLDILPDVDNGASDPFAAVADSEDEYRETTNLLARSQVAVYPIDARGLMTNPAFSASSSGSKYAHNPTAMSRDLNKFSSDQAGEHATMLRMADDTGGHAYINTNGLAEAVDKAIEDGSNYYTLTYTPTNTRWKGDFRKIQVKLAQQGYELEYRHGYYADDPNSASSAVHTGDNLASTDAATANRDPALILKVMAHGVPPATQILYKVRVVPTSASTEDQLAPDNILSPKVQGPYRRFSVDFAALPDDFTYVQTPDGLRHGAVEFIAVLYQRDGQMVNRVTVPIRANMTPAQFTRLRQVGFPCRLEISVPAKGDYWLRLGVHDMHSNKIGASELPIAAVKNLPPVPPPASHPAQAAPAPAAPASAAPPQ